jgi:phosphoglycerate kinase
MINVRKVQDADIKDRRTILRADLDVPLDGSQIEDSTRLEGWWSTLELLIQKANSITILGHLGRPQGEEEKLSVAPVARWIASKLDSNIQEGEFGEFKGWKANNKVIILENLRFYAAEEANDSDFSSALAKLGDIYVDDAFASSHRAHASIVGIPKIIPGYAGFRLQKEVEELSKVIDSPKRPLTIIVGGAKIETKLPLVTKMHKIADFVLVGGEIAEHVKELARVEHEKTPNKKSELLVADLTSDKEDINEESIQKFKEIIKSSKTIVWNGPMGEFEKCFDLGTREIASSMAQSSAHTIVGGGDTIAFLNKEGILSKFSFVSTGGGAML